METSVLVAGIDVAASRPCLAVVVRAGRRGLTVAGWHEADEHQPGAGGRLLDWLDGWNVAAVAVSAAQRPRRAAGAASMRRADAELLRRRIAVAPTPTRAQVEQAARRYAHVRAGWSYFKQLRRRGYETALPGGLPHSFGLAPGLLETYPHAGFVTLLRGTPPPRGSREGLHIRLLTLRRLGLEWDEYFDAVSLDTLMAAFTAWRFVQGLTTQLGDDKDGYVWLPVPVHELRDTYAPLGDTGARVAARALGEG